MRLRFFAPIGFNKIRKQRKEKFETGSFENVLNFDVLI